MVRKGSNTTRKARSTDSHAKRNPSAAKRSPPPDPGAGQTGKEAAGSGGRGSPQAPGGGLDPGLVYRDHAGEDLLALQLLEELEYRHGVDVVTLDFRIRQGLGLARGTVSDADELEAVRETMQDCGAIQDLTFLVQVSPDRREQDRDRARGVQEAVEHEADLAQENFQVACVGRKVILRGSVGDPVRKVKAGLLALRRGGVSRVINRLVVGDSGG